MLEQCCNHSKQCRNNVATLCCAKNRRCELSRVTSPLHRAKQRQQQQQKDQRPLIQKKTKQNTVVTVDRNLHFFLLFQSKATQEHLVLCNGIFRSKSPFTAYFNIQLFGKQS